MAMDKIVGSLNKANETKLGRNIAQISSPAMFTPLKTDASKDSFVSSDSSPAFSPPHKPHEVDPWELPELQDHSIPWSELDAWHKFKRIFVVIAKFLALATLLYLFICSLDFLSSAFRLVGGKAAGKVISNSELLQNPIVGLMIGVLVTVLVQSSSTSTSIAVTMVASDLIRVRQAIPIVMGANIGTSVTNTIVSLMQATDRNEFRRAFAAATVHDMFNWLTVIVLLPLEVTFGYLELITSKLVDFKDWKQESGAKSEFLKKLTKPLTDLVVKLDKNVLKVIATGGNQTASLLQECCKTKNVNNTSICVSKCGALLNRTGLSESVAGCVLLAISLFTLCLCLILIVKLLHSMLKGKIAVIIKKYINAEYKFPWSHLIGYMALFIGCVMTILVQSSSIFTSALTPLAGIGVISLERIYPLTLGANIGTTTTGILAALTADSRNLRNTLQLAFCHLFFNISGILLFYPIPFTRFPITLARHLGNITAKYRWFSILYLVLMFFLIPMFVFLLSLAGKVIFFTVGGIIALFLIIVIAINVIQSKKPSWLPLKLQNWNWLPLWMHSLDPLDGLIIKVGERFSFFSCCLQPASRHDTLTGLRTNQSQIHILEAARRYSATETHLMIAYDNVAFLQCNGTNSSPHKSESTHL
ncbi:sodium-dependent phosphate transport protein 2B-like protein [Dinothrombium tinctorium]|uniref:Sodium-dependent phosphate transport protein 2B-like protein n=1 Tax=Dinothrombium tinctorium TaxID=1965070 RepID=A0A443RMD3_9ACAR|nr:sodium-dependent phosphate transport protein 2B-like protein [Dinothrombium tinctorium]